MGGALDVKTQEPDQGQGAVPGAQQDEQAVTQDTQQTQQQDDTTMQGSPDLHADPQADDGVDDGADLARRLAEQNKRIQELEGQVAEAARSKQAEARLKSEIEDLKAKSADEHLSWQLEAAGARNVKAAKVLLADHGGDIAKLKDAEPWLFETAQSKRPTGTTGLEPSGAAGKGPEDDLKRWRRIAGLEDDKKE